MLASVEAGGTKFVCAIGDEKKNIVKTIQFPTEDPESTIKNLLDFLHPYKNKLEAISVASFGPIDIKLDSDTYGYITSTPKRHWENIDLIGPLSDAFSCPIFFTTDVNASAYGEMQARDKDNLVYYTIGTGIGGGVIINRKLLSGIGHLELGHNYLAKHPEDVNFSGVCPYHGACLEGLASGPSIEKRLGTKGENVSSDHPIWDIQAYYIAQATIQATLSYRPEVIVLGGGVMGQEHMLMRIKKHFECLLNGYVQIPKIDEYLVTPYYDNNMSATYGNFSLAQSLISEQ
ncbi:ROK family protein [Aerococcaceae bacterium DSM 111020]|nr:ROK family protein [Aerococcaceae bacterium DSM 111020]